MFLLLVVQAVVMILFWSLWWTGLLPFAWQRNPVYWHGHEMLNGLAGAAIGGFLLTAVANWTKRPAVAGWRVLLLCSIWLAGRHARADYRRHCQHDRQRIEPGSAGA